MKTYVSKKNLTTFTCYFQTLRPNIFAKTKKFKKPFSLVRMGSSGLF